MTFDELAQVFQQASDTFRREMPTMGEKIGQDIEERAKMKLGNYQPAAGPFVEWAELSPFTMSERAARGYEPDEPGLVTGIMRDLTRHTVTRVADNRVTVNVGNDLIEAKYFEEGRAGQPPRSFLGSAAIEWTGAGLKQIEEAIKKAGLD